MTDESMPDLVGTVRDVQRRLRERYGASEVNVDVDEHTVWKSRDSPDAASTSGGWAEHLDRPREYIGREEALTIRFDWMAPDIDAPEAADLPTVVRHVNLASNKLAQLGADFPAADVSTYVDRERVRVSVVLEEGHEL